MLVSLSIAAALSCLAPEMDFVESWLAHAPIRSVPRNDPTESAPQISLNRPLSPDR